MKHNIVDDVHDDALGIKKVLEDNAKFFHFLVSPQIRVENKHDIIDTTLYVVELHKNAATMAKVKDEFIKEPYPASTWIGITELVIPGTRAEIKVVARRPA